MADRTERERITDVLVEEWERFASLLDGLDESAWSTPTDLPGWDVRANVAHVIGIEAMLAGDPQPAAPVDLESRDHVRNEIAASNEAWVESMRHTPAGELVDRFREVTGRRTAQLRAMSDEEFSAPSWTPVGEADYARFMQIRVFDTWFHDQDIREAVGLPGNDDTAPANEALDEVVRVLGYVVGKRAGAPDGSAVTFELTGPMRRRLHVVVQGRARVVDALDRAADATIAVDSSTFMRLAGGRVEARTVLDRVRLDGDVELGGSILAKLGYTI